MAEPTETSSESSRVKPPEETVAADSVTLYAARNKLFVRSIFGVFTKWRWFFVWATQLVFYVSPWLSWDGRQAVLFDLSERKFYIFGWVFWPQDVFYLSLILMISAFGLFFFTAIAGRLWCGFACPQTVYTEIFMWIEEKIEGDHNKRRKLAKAPMDARKAGLRAAKFTAWGLFSLWTGFTFACYFSPHTELVSGVLAGTLGSWQLFWILFYAGFTYLFAGIMREQVCKYMCPYARFQSVMFDADTLVITYDTERGDPRGSRKKGIDPKTIGKGDCIDCNICVQVCPTGIDIRNGLQYECIGCAACIDACDQVMDQMKYPKGLIRYTTERAMEQHWTKKQILQHVARPRTLLYGAVLSLVIIGLLVGLAYRADLRMDILRDRAALYREVSDGLIENVYRVNIINMIEGERQVSLSVSGLNGIEIDGNKMISLPAGSMEVVTVSVLAPSDGAEPGSHEIFFEIAVVGDSDTKVRERSTFYLPR